MIRLLALLLLLSIQLQTCALEGIGLQSGAMEVGKSRLAAVAEISAFGNYPADWNMDRRGTRLFTKAERGIRKFRLELSMEQFQTVLRAQQKYDRNELYLHAAKAASSVTNGLLHGNCGSGFCVFTNGDWLVWKLYSPDVLLVRDRSAGRWAAYDVPFELSKMPCSEFPTNSLPPLDLDLQSISLYIDRDSASALVGSISEGRIRDFLARTPHFVSRVGILEPFDVGRVSATGVIVDRKSHGCVWQLLRNYSDSDSDRLILQLEDGSAYMYEQAK